MAKNGTGRLARDMCAAGLLGLSAAFASFSLWPSTPENATAPVLDGKRADRLAFDLPPEDVPVRAVRVYDSVAMFARPSAEPAPWSEMSPPRLPATNARTAPSERLTVASLPVTRPATVLPPQRPLATIVIRPASPVEPERRPLRVAGWNVPGTQFLPDGRDAAAAIDFVDDGARTVGTGAVRLATQGVGLAADGFGAVGQSVSRAGRSVAGAIRLP